MKDLWYNEIIIYNNEIRNFEYFCLFICGRSNKMSSYVSDENRKLEEKLNMYTCI